MPYASGLITLTLLATSIAFSKFIVKLNLVLAFITNIISYAYSTFAFFIATLVFSVILDLINAPKELFTFAMVIVSACTFFIINIPFRFKRYRKGMPFLKDKNMSTMGLISSVLTLVCLFMTYVASNEFMILILIISLTVLSLLLLIWWKSQIKRSYLKKLHAIELENMQLALEKQQKEIDKLTKDNDNLARVIHKDNKLVPAMGFSVKSFLESYENENSANIKAKATALIKQLEEITCERQGILENYRHTTKILPKTNVDGVDSIVLYMSQKSMAINIEFDLMINGDISFMAENIIDENQLTTLISDLIENAIIAIKPCSTRRILVNLGKNNEGYFIEVADSGIPFEIDTLVHLGTMKITTHKHEGGSGIGLSNAFDLFRQYNASFIIEEFINSDLSYTKKLIVSFNGKGQYIVKSPRAEQIKSSPFKTNLIVETAV